MQPAHDPEIARRRIEQLESALQRRTELLERKQAELLGIQSSHAYRAARMVQKAIDRAFPLHTRRRGLLKSAGRMLLAPWRARRHRNGPPTSERFHSQCVPPAEYARWIARNEPQARDLAAQRRAAFARAPLFSIVVPVYNPPAEFLKALLQSVREQTYARWELCLADASTAGRVRDLLERAAAADGRIRVCRLPSNGGIVGNSNAALSMATGDYVVFADHDDELAPFALHELASAINRQPAADFLYSDEDKLDFRGRRVEPMFKPDWSPDLLRARNYICHLVCVKRELVNEVGGFRAGFDGAQDHDFVLRCTERAACIVHVPAVLYHWRMHAQSTAAFKESKSYAYDAGKRAVAEHMQRLGIEASVSDGPVLGTYQVSHHLREQPLVSVIVPNRDHPEMLARCVRSVLESGYANIELLIVENGSRQAETFAYYRELEQRPNVRILRWERSFNYAAVNNFAARQARGELLLFLNNDVEAIGPDWLEAMVKHALLPGVGAVGAKLYYPDDTVQHAGIVVGMGGVAGHSHLHYPRHAPGHDQRLLVVQNVSAVTGACLLCPRRVFEAVGGFDEGFVLAFNDVDLCLAILSAGHRIVWTPEAELYHFESKTRGYEDTPEKQLRFRRESDLFHLKWGRFLAAGDPYYSRHFRLDRADFALRAA